MLRKLLKQQTSYSTPLMVRQILATEKNRMQVLGDAVFTPKNINLEIHHQTIALTISQHDKSQNTINMRVLNELNNILTSDALENAAILKIQSGKENMFVTGADVNAFAYAASAEEIEAFFFHAQAAFNRLANHHKLQTIAIINGYALGGGLELALAAKYRLGFADAKLGLVEVLLGVFPTIDGCQRLTDLLGPVEAARLIVSGEMLNAKQALQVGLLDRIVQSKEEINDFVRQLESGQITREAKAPFTLSDDDKASLGRLNGMIYQLYETQLQIVKNLKKSQHISLEQAANIRNWLTAVRNARVAVMNVIHEQLEASDSNQKAKIERKAFAKLAMTSEAKFAIQFWLLNKKKYEHEHKMIREHLMNANCFYIPEIPARQQDLVEEKNPLRMGFRE
jgi:enoyl-CoA hydratase/carnithine racemase